MKSYPHSDDPSHPFLALQFGTHQEGVAANIMVTPAIMLVERRLTRDRHRTPGVPMLLTIDVISDVVCPWCYIGKRRLEKAIASLNGQHDVRIKWHPYQLNPALPPEGVSRREYRIGKFGSWERSQELDARLISVGETEGLHFAFDRIERTPNTRDAHRLIWLADKLGCQDAVMEGLFRAYFTDGRDISDRQVLIDVVSEAGLDRLLATSMLNSSEGLDAMQLAEERSRCYGVSGVPFFVLNEKLALSGAQPPEAFLEAFQQAAE